MTSGPRSELWLASFPAFDRDELNCPKACDWLVNTGGSGIFPVSSKGRPTTIWRIGEDSEATYENVAATEISSETATLKTVITKSRKLRCIISPSTFNANKQPFSTTARPSAEVIEYN